MEWEACLLRVEAEDGWWLITHPDHAGLAADFAEHWGNDLFPPPEPRGRVLHGIRVHDDGWAERDASPRVTRQGKPSAFSEELVGKYSAFEEIDLADYLAVRERALHEVEEKDVYAALLVSMHTYNLLTERADRSTIAADQLPLLDAFLERQKERQGDLRGRLGSQMGSMEDASIYDNFCLLQAMDNLSLYSCVGYRLRGSLLHALPTADGRRQTVEVISVAPRHFRLAPYPMDEPELEFAVRARYVEGREFASSAMLTEKFAAAAVEMMKIQISS